MKVKIYDTHVNTANKYYHFDVVVVDASQEEVETYAKTYLKKIGVEHATITQSRCQFCHEEIADREVLTMIEKEGYFIIPMQGCKC